MHLSKHTINLGTFVERFRLLSCFVFQDMALVGLNSKQLVLLPQLLSSGIIAMNYHCLPALPSSLLFLRQGLSHVA